MKSSPIKYRGGLESNLKQCALSRDRVSLENLEKPIAILISSEKSRVNFLYLKEDVYPFFFNALDNNNEAGKADQVT